MEDKFKEWVMVVTAAFSAANVTAALAETPNNPFAPIEAEQFLVTTSTASGPSADVTGVAVVKDLRAESGRTYSIELVYPDDA